MSAADRLDEAEPVCDRGRLDAAADRQLDRTLDTWALAVFSVTNRARPTSRSESATAAGIDYCNR